MSNYSVIRKEIHLLLTFLVVHNKRSFSRQIKIRGNLKVRLNVFASKTMKTEISVRVKS